MYRPLLWFFLLGAMLPVVVFFLRRRIFPSTRWMQKIHVPLFLGGLNYIPPASGTNYGSWAVVGLLFGLLVKRKQGAWWRRYNFVLSSALDCSVAIAGIVIFFAVFYTGAVDNLKWWGTEVYQVCEPDAKLESFSPCVAERTTANDTCLPYRIRAIGRAAAICSALQTRVLGL